jgi:hypothetical protein
MNEMPFIETKRKVGRRTASSILKYMGRGEIGSLDTGGGQEPL